MFRLQSPAPAPKGEANAQGFHQFNLKVDKDITQADVDMAKNLMRGYYTEAKEIDIRHPEGKHPLIVVDGKVMGNVPGTLAKISPDQIESISVSKDQTVISVYGEKAKDGVIAIILKKDKK